MIKTTPTSSHHERNDLSKFIRHYLLRLFPLDTMICNVHVLPDRQNCRISIRFLRSLLWLNAKIIFWFPCLSRRGGKFESVLNESSPSRKYKSIVLVTCIGSHSASKIQEANRRRRQRLQICHPNNSVRIHNFGSSHLQRLDLQ
jgi:hypothetical protein